MTEVQKRDDVYQHRRHNKNLSMVHLIFVTKYQKQILSDRFRQDIKQYLCDACTRYHWYVRRIETDKDHVHTLIQYNPTDSITGIVSQLKQHSTYRAWKEHHALLKHHYWREKTLWSDGYFVVTVGMVSKETIERYIENQG